MMIEPSAQITSIGQQVIAPLNAQAARRVSPARNSITEMPKLDGFHR